MRRHEPSPPALARALLHLLLPRVLRDEMEGDLFEGFTRRVDLYGEASARRWFWRQLTSLRPISLRIVLRSAEGHRTHPHPRGFEMSDWVSEFKQALRFLLRRRSATLAIVLTIALAVTATTTVFSVVNGVLLRPLPYEDPGRLVNIWQTNDEWLNSENEALRRYAKELPTSVLIASDWASRTNQIEALGVYSRESFIYRGSEGPSLVDGASANAGMFQVLGVRAAKGRTLIPADDRPGAEPVAVLSHGAWETRFGGDPRILGESLPLGSNSFTIVGVMPRDFRFPAPDVEFWVSIPDSKKEGDRGELWVSAIARLRDGGSLEAARTEMESIQANLVRTYPDEMEEWGVHLVPLLESMVGEIDTTLWLLFGSVALTLLVACVNVANLLSLLSLTRRQEMAVRAAMGAGRGRLARSSLAESFLLSGSGGLLGIGLTALALPILVGILPAEIPRRESIQIDPAVLAFGVGLILVATVLVGLVPGIRSSRALPAHLLGGSARTQSGSRGAIASRNLFVVAEVSLAVVLLMGAALLGNSFARLWSVDRGFDSEGLVTMSILPDRTRHPDRNARDQLFRELRAELGTIPGVAVTAANQAPLSRGTAFRTYELEGSEAEPEEAILILTVVLDGYFRFMGIPVIDGRAFEPSDGRDTPLVAMVNRTAAEALWPGESAIGKRLRQSEEHPWVTVVGVTGDIRHQALEIAPEPMVYLPAEQINIFPATWIARSPGDLHALSSLLRNRLRSLSPGTPILSLGILEQEVSRSVAVPRFRTVFVCGLAGMAALLALLGVYGVVGFSVSQRTREIGIRMAVGSDPDGVIFQVLRSGLILLGIGIAVGLAVALPAGRLLAEFLFQVQPFDPLTFLATGTLVAFVGLLAAYWPARRAARVDPVTVLNSE